MKEILTLALDIVLIALLAGAAFWDLRYRKIPNLLTMPALLIGLALQVAAEGGPGLLDSFLGLGAGFLLFLFPFLSGAMGGGDLKLAAAIGALKGWLFLLQAMAVSIVAGGFLILIYAIYKGRLKETLMKTIGYLAIPLGKALYLGTGREFFRRLYEPFLGIGDGAKPLYVPYGLPMALGSLIVLTGVLKPFFGTLL